MWLVRDRAPTLPCLEAMCLQRSQYTIGASLIPQIYWGAREQQVLSLAVFTEQQDCPALDSGALLSPACHPLLCSTDC